MGSQKVINSSDKGGPLIPLDVHGGFILVTLDGENIRLEKQHYKNNRGGNPVIVREDICCPVAMSNQNQESIIAQCPNFEVLNKHYIIEWSKESLECKVVIYLVNNLDFRG